MSSPIVASVCGKGSDEQGDEGTGGSGHGCRGRAHGPGLGRRRWHQVDALGGDMDELKARVIVSVLGSAATVVTLASVLGAGKKWAR